MSNTPIFTPTGGHFGFVRFSEGAPWFSNFFQFFLRKWDQEVSSDQFIRSSWWSETMTLYSPPLLLHIYQLGKIIFRVLLIINFKKTKISFWVFYFLVCLFVFFVFVLLFFRCVLFCLVFVCLFCFFIYLKVKNQIIQLTFIQNTFKLHKIFCKSMKTTSDKFLRSILIIVHHNLFLTQSKPHCLLARNNTLQQWYEIISHHIITTWFLSITNHPSYKIMAINQNQILWSLRIIFHISKTKL